MPGKSGRCDGAELPAKFGRLADWNVAQLNLQFTGLVAAFGWRRYDGAGPIGVGESVAACGASAGCGACNAGPRTFDIIGRSDTFGVGGRFQSFHGKL